MSARRSRSRRSSSWSTGFNTADRRHGGRRQAAAYFGPATRRGRGPWTGGRGPVHMPDYGPPPYDNRAARRAARRSARGWAADNGPGVYPHWTGGPSGSVSVRGGRRPGGSLVARSPRLLCRAAWKYRWQLAPVAGGGLVFAAGALAPVIAALVLAGTAAGAWWWARSGAQLRDRMLLSVLERRSLALWTAAASVWLLCAALPAPAAGSPWLLAASLAYPGYRWGASRRVRRVHRLSPAAQAVVDRWTEAVAMRGPGPLQGSRIIRSTVKEPAEGAYTFTVQLAAGVHGREAATDAGRRGVEVELHLPVDTAALEPDRDDATRMHVTLTPSRHLSTKPPEWEGPQLADDGTMPIADAPDGERISIAVYNPDGVEHCFIVGTSGAGKSSTTATIALPGPNAGIETLWMIDGKEGGSAPYLAAACDWYASSPEAWGQVIDAAHAVLLERKRRRSGKHRWDTPNEPDPILTVLIDEATSVAVRTSSARHAKVLEMLREGRSLGVRIIQVAQDPMGTDLLGGRKARDLMTGAGAMLAHRPGGSLAGRIALDSTSNRSIDLTSLPPEPGFLAVIRRGRVLAPVARVRHATPAKAGTAASRITPRSLGEADTAAAGPAYAGRMDGAVPAVEQPAAAVPTPREEAQTTLVDGESTTTRLARHIVAETLAGVDRPVPRGWIVRRTGLAPATVTKALAELEADECAERVRGQKWQAIP
jgi:hypothetical protein